MNTNRYNDDDPDKRMREFPYSKERVEELKDLVADFYEQGKRKRYAILVNGELVVGINHDPENFDAYLRYMKPYTRTVEVRMYYGDSPHFKRYLFKLASESLEGPTQGFAAPIITDPSQSIEHRLTQALERQRLEHENQRLQEKCEHYRRKLKKSKKRLSENGSGMDMKELISQGIQLYGQINAGKTAPAVPMQGLPQAEVEIEAEDSEADNFYQFLKSQYGDEQLEEALKTWELFVKHPELRAEFQQLITSKS